MELSKLIDFCINSKGAASDVACVGQKVLKHKFRYQGDNTWEIKNNDTDTWVVDTDRTKIDMAIKVDVCQAFMERAFFWQEQSLGAEISEKIDCQLRSQKLLEICLKLGKDKYVKDVIKELRAFLSVENY